VNARPRSAAGSPTQETVVEGRLAGCERTSGAAEPLAAPPATDFRVWLHVTK